MLNIAIIGAGNIGKTHARCYRNNKNTKVVAFVDIMKDKADAAAKEFECASFATVQDLLKAGLTIDAASVTTAGKENGGDHYQPTIELLSAGIQVLGEKPISNEIPKGREMVALARQKGLRYGINLNHRFTPAATRAREWIEQGRLGSINLMNMTMWINNPNESSPHFHMRALHPHSIDVMRYFCGDVARVHAFFKKGEGRTIWSNVHVNMQFTSGVIGHLTGSYDAGAGYGLETCDIVGSKGRLVIQEAAEVLTYYPRFTKEVETYRHLGNMGGFGDTFQSRIDAWIDDVINNVAPDQVDGKAEDALKAQLIIESAIQSWETGAVVDVPSTADALANA